MKAQFDIQDVFGISAFVANTPGDNEPLTGLWNLKNEIDNVSKNL